MRSPIYEYRGVRLTITEWAKRTGISAVLIRKRLATGQAFEQAIRMPRRRVAA